MRPGPAPPSHNPLVVITQSDNHGPDGYGIDPFERESRSLLDRDRDSP
jgi:hypothetical protein